MLFIFLDINLDLGSTRIELIPDFLGYIFIIQGLAELIGESERFAKARPYAIGMCVYTALLFLMDLFGVSYDLGEAILILGLVSTIISLVISYHIVMGVKDIEFSSGRQLNANELMSKWKLLAIVSILIYILYFMPVFNVIAILTGLVVGIVYLVAFNRTKKLYYDEM